MIPFSKLMQRLTNNQDDTIQISKETNKNNNNDLFSTEPFDDDLPDIDAFFDSLDTKKKPTTAADLVENNKANKNVVSPRMPSSQEKSKNNAAPPVQQQATNQTGERKRDMVNRMVTRAGQFIVNDLYEDLVSAGPARKASAAEEGGAANSAVTGRNSLFQLTKVDQEVMNIICDENRKLKQLLEQEKEKNDELKEQTEVLKQLEEEASEDNEILKYKVMSLETLANDKQADMTQYNMVGDLEKQKKQLQKQVSKLKRELQFVYTIQKDSNQNVKSSEDLAVNELFDQADLKQSLADIKMLYESNKIDLPEQDQLRIIKALYLGDKPVIRMYRELLFQKLTQRAIESAEFMYLQQVNKSTSQSSGSNNVDYRQQSKLYRDNRQLRQDNKRYKKMVDELQAKLAQEEQMNEKFKRKQLQISKRALNIRKDMNTLKVNLEDIRNESLEQQDLVQDYMEPNLQMLCSKIQLFQEESSRRITESGKAVYQKNKEISDLFNQNNQLKMQLNELIQYKEASTKAMFEKNDQIGKLHMQNRDLQQENEEFQTYLADVQEQNHKLSSDFEQLQRKFTQLSNENSKIAQLKEQIDRLTQDNQLLKVQYSAIKQPNNINSKIEKEFEQMLDQKEQEINAALKPKLAQLSDLSKDTDNKSNSLIKELNMSTDVVILNTKKQDSNSDDQKQNIMSGFFNQFMQTQQTPLNQQHEQQTTKIPQLNLNKLQSPPKEDNYAFLQGVLNNQVDDKNQFAPQNQQDSSNRNLNNNNNQQLDFFSSLMLSQVDNQQQVNPIQEKKSSDDLFGFLTNKQDSEEKKVTNNTLNQQESKNDGHGGGFIDDIFSNLMSNPNQKQEISNQVITNTIPKQAENNIILENNQEPIIDDGAWGDSDGQQMQIIDFQEDKDVIIEEEDDQKMDQLNVEDNQVEQEKQKRLLTPRKQFKSQIEDQLSKVTDSQPTPAQETNSNNASNNKKKKKHASSSVAQQQMSKTQLVENLNVSDEGGDEQWCSSPNRSGQSKHSRSRSMDLSMTFGGKLAQKEADMVADLMAQEENKQLDNQIQEADKCVVVSDLEDLEALSEEEGGNTANNGANKWTRDVVVFNEAAEVEEDEEDGQNNNGQQEQQQQNKQADDNKRTNEKNEDKAKNQQQSSQEAGNAQNEIDYLKMQNKESDSESAQASNLASVRTNELQKPEIDDDEQQQQEVNLIQYYAATTPRGDEYDPKNKQMNQTANFTGTMHNKILSDPSATELMYLEENHHQQMIEEQQEGLNNQQQQQQEEEEVYDDEMDDHHHHQHHQHHQEEEEDGGFVAEEEEREDEDDEPQSSRHSSQYVKHNSILERNLEQMMGGLNQSNNQDDSQSQSQQSASLQARTPNEGDRGLSLDMDMINYDPNTAKAQMNFMMRNLNSSGENSMPNSRGNSLPNSRQGSIVEHHKINSFMGSFVAQPIIEEGQDHEGGWENSEDIQDQFNLPLVEELNSYHEEQKDMSSTCKDSSHIKKNSDLILEQEKSLETINITDQSERKIQDLTNSAIQEMLKDVPLTQRGDERQQSQDMSSLKKTLNFDEDPDQQQNNQNDIQEEEEEPEQNENGWNDDQDASLEDIDLIPTPRDQQQQQVPITIHSEEDDTAKKDENNKAPIQEEDPEKSNPIETQVEEERPQTQNYNEEFTFQADDKNDSDREQEPQVTNQQESDPLADLDAENGWGDDDQEIDLDFGFDNNQQKQETHVDFLSSLISKPAEETNKDQKAEEEKINQNQNKQTEEVVIVDENEAGGWDDDDDIIDI